MAAKLEKAYSNAKFKDPEWYTSVAVDFLDMKWGALAKDLAKALNPETQDTAKELVEMYVSAYNQCSITKNYKAKAKKEYVELFFQQQIDPDFPTHHCLFHILLNDLKDAKFKASDFEIEEHWVSAFRGDFAAEFNELLRLHSDSYPSAYQYISKLKLKKPIEAQVHQHVNELLYEVEQEPLAIDQQLTLEKSYVSPACEFKNVKVPSGSKEEETQSENCLISALLKHIENSDNPIVLHGQPGHGKTSTVKVLTRTITGLYKDTAEPPITLLFEFKHLGNLNRAAIDILSEQARFIENDLFFMGKKTVVILDGLDERQAAEGNSDQFLKDFITNLFNLAGKVNKTADSRLNLIVTGRSQYVGQINNCFNKNHSVFDITDFDENKRALWIAKFNQQKQFNEQEQLTLSQFEQYKLDELISQPILLSISAIMLTDPEGRTLIAEFEGKPITRALIYRTIIQWSYDKRWHKDSHSESWKDTLRFDDYFVLLQAIAFEMVKAGAETIKLSVLAEALQNNSKKIFDLLSIQNMRVDDLEHLCAQLRISFFFKGVEDKAFAFIHKSFKDFLLVSGIVDAVPRIFEDFRDDKPNRTDEEIVSLFSQKPFSDEDHIDFLTNWLEIRTSDLDKYTSAAYAIWRRIIDGELQIENKTSGEQSYKLAVTSYNFLQIISRWFAKSKNLEGTRVLSYEGKVKLLDNHHRYLYKQHNLTHRYFSNQLLDYQRFEGDHRSCNFSDSVILRCDISFSQFIECNFSHAELINVSVEQTRFFKCDFSNLKADLKINLTFMIGVVNCVFINCKFEDTVIDCLVRKNSRNRVVFQECDFRGATIVNRENMNIINCKED